MQTQKNQQQQKNKIAPKPAAQHSACPYDDFACRVYEFCGTKKCSKKAEKLRQTED